MKTKKEVKESLEKLGYVYLDFYMQGKERKVIIQDKYGYKYDVYLNNILKGQNVSFVDVGNPFTLSHNIPLWLKLENKSFELCPNNVLYKGAKENLLFRCLNSECGEIFSMSWNHIFRGLGCKICSGREVGERNNFAYLRPELTKEWNYELNEIAPENVTEFSSIEVYWVCSDCGYGLNGEWQSRVCSRANGSGCPACSGRVVSEKNRLSIHFPEIAAEWHPSKNGDLTPKDVSHGSGKRVWWLCPNGHEYSAKINHRTNMGSGCSKCNSSKGESMIKGFLDKNNVENIFQHKFEYCKNKNILSFDFYLPDFNLCIEYHGKQHYETVDFAGRGIEWAKNQFKENKKRDKIKEKYCKENNIPLLIIPYWEYKNIENILEKNLFYE